MRHVLFAILIICLISCDTNSFEKDYYEKITGLKFPSKYKVLETFDNGEWLTGTVFQIDNSILKEFVIANQFDTLHNLNDLRLLSSSYLTRHIADFKSTQNIYFINKSVNRNHWTYVADLNENKLWTEISYPDWGGR